MDEKSNKICYTCKYFYQHYGLSRGKFKPINFGHCLNMRVSKSNILVSPYKDTCDNWEENQGEESITNEDLTQTFKQVLKQMNEFAYLLENKQKNKDV